MTLECQVAEMATTELWEGQFGQSYHARNRVRWRDRISFFQTIAKITQARSAFEVGCGPGWNLSALRACGVHRVSGVDLNETACREARNAGLSVQRGGVVHVEHQGEADLSFTCGCLIHIPPSELGDMMRAIAVVSRRYVLAIEYAANEETEVEYRGHAGALWKRPYGKLYEAMGLKCIERGFLGKESGFDECHYWLLEKPQA